MGPSPDDVVPSPSPTGSARSRDRGVRRSRRLTRWITVAAVSGAAALGSLYAHLVPGSSASPVPAGPAPHDPAASSAAVPKADDEDGHGDEHRGDTSRHAYDDGDDEGDEGEHEDENEDDDAATAPSSQPAPRPPAQPPAPTGQPPHTTTGAS